MLLLPHVLSVVGDPDAVAVRDTEWRRVRGRLHRMRRSSPGRPGWMRLFALLQHHDSQHVLLGQRAGAMGSIAWTSVTMDNTDIDSIRYASTRWWSFIRWWPHRRKIIDLCDEVYRLRVVAEEHQTLKAQFATQAKGISQLIAFIHIRHRLDAPVASGSIREALIANNIPRKPNRK